MLTANIGIVSCGRLGVLRGQIESIVRHTTDVDYLITIIDGTRNLASYESLKNQYPAIRVIPGTDHRTLEARNKGNDIPACYYVECDDDCFVTPNWLSRILIGFEKYPTVQVIAPILTFRGDLFYPNQVFMIPKKYHEIFEHDEITNTDLDRMNECYARYLSVSTDRIAFRIVPRLELTVLVKRNTPPLLWDRRLDAGRQTCRANEDLSRTLYLREMQQAVALGVPVFHCVRNYWKKDPRVGRNCALAHWHFRRKWKGWADEPPYPEGPEHKMMVDWDIRREMHLKNTLRNDHNLDDEEFDRFR